MAPSIPSLPLTTNEVESMGYEQYPQSHPLSDLPGATIINETAADAREATATGGSGVARDSSPTEDMTKSKNGNYTPGPLLKPAPGAFVKKFRTADAKDQVRLVPLLQRPLDIFARRFL